VIGSIPQKSGVVRSLNFSPSTVVGIEYLIIYSKIISVKENTLAGILLDNRTDLSY
jgi:hypothetical protein